MCVCVCVCVCVYVPVCMCWCECARTRTSVHTGMTACENEREILCIFGKKLNSSSTDYVYEHMCVCM